MANDNPIFTVFRGRFPCKFCDQAVTLLVEHGLPYVESKLEMSDLIMKQAGYRHHTVPLILHGDEFIGGASDLSRYLNR